MESVIYAYPGVDSPLYHQNWEYHIFDIEDAMSCDAFLIVKLDGDVIGNIKVTTEIVDEDGLEYHLEDLRIHDWIIEDYRAHPCTCPHCGDEFEDDASEETSIADHGMCWSCHKKWQLGEDNDHSNEPDPWHDHQEMFHIGDAGPGCEDMGAY